MIYLNNNELQDLHIGDKEIQSVFLGNRLIWERFSLIYLGYGRTFDVSNIKDYQYLTASNFFVRVTEKPSVSDSVTGSSSGEDGGINTYLNKSYNASSGVFTFSYQARSDGGKSTYVGGYVYLIPNLTDAIDKGKVIELASGRSWNIKSLLPNDYQNLTTDNFAIQSATTCMTGNVFYGGTFSYAGYGSLSLSYNASSGVLSGSNSITMTNTASGYINNQTTSIKPFLFAKV